MPKTHKDLVNGVFLNKDKLLQTLTYTFRDPRRIGKGDRVYRIICEIPPRNVPKAEIHLRVLEEAPDSNTSLRASTVRAESLSGTVGDVPTLLTTGSRQDLTGAVDVSTFAPAATSFNTVRGVDAETSRMQRGGPLDQSSERSPVWTLNEE